MALLRTLQDLWPLATCSVQENALDGTLEAAIVVPRARDERMRALRWARKSRVAELLAVMCSVLLFLALGTYANDCYTSFTMRTLPNATVHETAKGKSEL